MLSVPDFVGYIVNLSVLLQTVHSIYLVIRGIRNVISGTGLVTNLA